MERLIGVPKEGKSVEGQLKMAELRMCLGKRVDLELQWEQLKRYVAEGGRPRESAAVSEAEGVPLPRLSSAAAQPSAENGTGRTARLCVQDAHVGKKTMHGGYKGLVVGSSNM